MKLGGAASYSDIVLDNYQGGFRILNSGGINAVLVMNDGGNVGIGTQSPGGALTIASTNPDSVIKAKQGSITFFSDRTNYLYDTDLVFDGGNDGIFFFDNNGINGGRTTFRNAAYTEILTLMNNGEVRIPTLAGGGLRYLCVDDVGTLFGCSIFNPY